MGTSRRELITGSVAMTLPLGVAAAGLAPASQAYAERLGAKRPQDVDETIWMTWYDLPENRADEYLAWLHGSYLPELLKRPGYNWAAHFKRIPYPAPEFAEYAARMQVQPKDAPKLGRGSQYVLMVGATDLEPFLPAPSYDLRDAEPAAAKPMLSARQGVRSAVLRDALRGNGPAVTARPQPGPPGPRIQLGSWQVFPDMTPETWKYYLSHRYPQFRDTQGGISARTLIGLVGWVHSAILYEFVSHEAHMGFLSKSEGPWIKRYMADPNMMQPTKISLHAPGSPMYADRIWASSRAA